MQIAGVESAMTSQIDSGGFDLTPALTPTRIGSEQGGGSPSESRVLNEMRTQGLETAPTDQANASSKTFSEIFSDSLSKVNEYQHQADHAIHELVAGKNKNIHETLLTIERADASLKLMMQVRNKILDAYKEIMRMQV